MKIILPLLIGLISLPNHAGATAMSPDRSRCYSLEGSVIQHRAWKEDFHRFLDEYETLSSDLKFRASKSALLRIASSVKDLEQMSEVRAPKSLVDDADRLIADIDSRNISTQAATRVMRSGLVKLEDAMDEMIYRAQIRNPDCELIPNEAREGQPQTQHSSR